MSHKISQQEFSHHTHFSSLFSLPFEAAVAHTHSVFFFAAAFSHTGPVTTAVTVAVDVLIGSTGDTSMAPPALPKLKVAAATPAAGGQNGVATVATAAVPYMDRAKTARPTLPATYPPAAPKKPMFFFVLVVEVVLVWF